MRPTATARSFSRRPVVAALVVALLFAALAPGAPAAADLVILPEGGYLRVDRWELRDDRLHVELASGGRMTLSLLRVERIVEELPSADPAPASTSWSLRWSEGAAAPATPWGGEILEAARRHGLAPDLVAAVASAESAFRADAVSPKGARGLMQLMPATAERFGLDPALIHDPVRNLDVGARYLRWLADRFEDRLDLVLAAYNAGEGTVDRYDGVPPYRETRAYVGRVYARLGLEPEPASGGRSAASR